MKRTLYSVIICCFFICAAAVCLNAAVVATADGNTSEYETISFENDQLSAYTKDKSKVVLNRTDIKNISFAAEKHEQKLEPSDAGDMKPYMLKAAEMIKKYPDVRYIVLSDEVDYALRPDGTNVYRTHDVVYVAKEEALWNAERSIGFDPNREKIKVLYARSCSPDGRITNLSESEIKIEKGSSGSVYFNQYETLSFSIPGVVVGSIVECCYEREEFNPFDRNMFDGRNYFKWGAPVGEALLRVTIPKDKKLYFISKNCPDNFEPEVSRGYDTKVYTWVMHDLEPIINETHMPAYRDIVPSVYFSLHQNRDYINDKLKPMYEKRFDLTDAVKKKVDEITAGCSSVREKIAKLYLFCQKEIRYISIKSNLASNQVGHPAEETLRNRYGDCTDKGMLLATMLKHIGVRAYPVVIRTNSAGSSVCDLGIFDDNHCITEVHLDGRIFYLDATASDYRYPYFRSDDHGTVAKNAMLGTMRCVPLPPPEDNELVSNMNVDLHSDGTVDIVKEITMNGSIEAGLRGAVRSLKPEEYEKIIRSSISGYTADYNLDIATFTDPLDFDKQLKTKTSYTLKRFAPKSGKYMIFAIPGFELGFSEVSLKERKYDIEYETSELVNERIKIKIPEDYTVKYIPPALRIIGPYIEFEVIYDLQGNSIDITRKLAVLKRKVPVEDYHKYKLDLEKIAASAKRKIVFQRVEKSDDMGGLK